MVNFARVRLLLRHLLWIISDSIRGQSEEMEMRIDPKRINEQDRRDRRRGLYDDVEFRQRVKDRMRDGKKCPHPPWYDQKTKRPLGLLEFREGIRKVVSKEGNGGMR
jgi:hypothetical protein